MRQFDDSQLEVMQELFWQANCDRPQGWLDSDIGRAAASAEIEERQYWFRVRYVPWFDHATTLQDARLLEIGSGNGSSAVPLAMAGAHVAAVDIDTTGHAMAVQRAEFMGVGDRLTFHTANAVDIGDMFEAGQFSAIAFSASLEHMTFDERRIALRSAWDLLRTGGSLVIVDTPNRLWYFDNHTSDSPFFHWLPDDVAVAYARHTPRADFAADSIETDRAALVGRWGPEIPEPLVRLARWGRGVSYHDIAIALDEDVTKMHVDGEWEFRRQNDPDYATWWAGTVEGRYQGVLREIAPEVPVAFLEPEIAISITKP